MYRSRFNTIIIIDKASKVDPSLPFHFPSLPYRVPTSLLPYGHYDTIIPPKPSPSGSLSTCSTSCARIVDLLDIGLDTDLDMDAGMGTTDTVVL